MNPLKWSREHKVALLITVMIGALVGFLLGWIGFNLSRGASGGMGLGRYVNYWLSGHSTFTTAPLWALTGALVGGAVIYVIRLMGER